MEAVLANWGNSLGLRIPKMIADMLRLKKGSKMNFELIDGKIILSPLSSIDDAKQALKQMAQGLNLKKMVKKVSQANKHLLEEDRPSGSEMW